MLELFKSLSRARLLLGGQVRACVGLVRRAENQLRQQRQENRQLSGLQLPDLRERTAEKAKILDTT